MFVSRGFCDFHDAQPPSGAWDRLDVCSFYCRTDSCSQAWRYLIPGNRACFFKSTIDRLLPLVADRRIVGFIMSAAVEKLSAMLNALVALRSS